MPNLAAALIDAKRAGGPRNIDGINLQGFLVGARPCTPQVKDARCRWIKVVVLGSRMAFVGEPW